MSLRERTEVSLGGVHTRCTHVRGQGIITVWKVDRTELAAEAAAVAAAATAVPFAADSPPPPTAPVRPQKSSDILSNLLLEPILMK